MSRISLHGLWSILRNFWAGPLAEPVIYKVPSTNRLSATRLRVPHDNIWVKDPRRVVVLQEDYNWKSQYGQVIAWYRTDNVTKVSEVNTSGPVTEGGLGLTTSQSDLFANTPVLEVDGDLDTSFTGNYIVLCGRKASLGKTYNQAFDFLQRYARMLNVQRIDLLPERILKFEEFLGLEPNTSDSSNIGATQGIRFGEFISWPQQEQTFTQTVNFTGPILSNYSLANEPSRGTVRFNYSETLSFPVQTVSRIAGDYMGDGKLWVNMGTEPYPNWQQIGTVDYSGKEIDFDFSNVTNRTTLNSPMLTALGGTTTSTLLVSNIDNTGPSNTPTPTVSYGLRVAPGHHRRHHAGYYSVEGGGTLWPNDNNPDFHRLDAEPPGLDHHQFTHGIDPVVHSSQHQFSDRGAPADPIFINKLPGRLRDGWAHGDMNAAEKLLGLTTDDLTNMHHLAYPSTDGSGGYAGFMSALQAEKLNFTAQTLVISKELTVWGPREWLRNPYGYHSLAALGQCDEIHALWTTEDLLSINSGNWPSITVSRNTANWSSVAVNSSISAAADGYTFTKGGFDPTTQCYIFKNLVNPSPNILNTIAYSMKHNIVSPTVGAGNNDRNPYGGFSFDQFYSSNTRRINYGLSETAPHVPVFELATPPHTNSLNLSVAGRTYLGRYQTYAYEGFSSWGTFYFGDEGKFLDKYDLTESTKILPVESSPGQVRLGVLNSTSGNNELKLNWVWFVEGGKNPAVKLGVFRALNATHTLSLTAWTDDTGGGNVRVGVRYQRPKLEFLNDGSGQPQNLFPETEVELNFTPDQDRREYEVNLTSLRPNQDYEVWIYRKPGRGAAEGGTLSGTAWVDDWDVRK